MKRFIKVTLALILVVCTEIRPCQYAGDCIGNA